jgi:hypothetical protein
MLWEGSCYQFAVGYDLGIMAFGSVPARAYTCCLRQRVYQGQESPTQCIESVAR